jgi:hypothetical protein
MELQSVQRTVAAVELFIKTEPVTATQRGFWQQFQRRDAPSRNTGLLWLPKWRQEGSVKGNKPQGCAHAAPTPDNVESVRDAILRSPFHRDCRKLLKDRAVSYKVSYSNSNDSDKFSWTWNVPGIINKCLSTLPWNVISFQNRQVFLAHCVHIL